VDEELLQVDLEAVVVVAVQVKVQVNKLLVSKSEILRLSKLQL
jgi:hypothetical protein